MYYFSVYTNFRDFKVEAANAYEAREIAEDKFLIPGEVIEAVDVGDGNDWPDHILLTA